jgi:tryptophan-rich sensory protein
MDRVENNDAARTEADWPQRVGLLAILGLVAGFIIYAIADMPESQNPELGYMVLCCTVVASIVFGFVVERGRILRAAIFAAATAAVCAFVVYRNTAPMNSWGMRTEWPRSFWQRGSLHRFFRSGKTR